MNVAPKLMGYQLVTDIPAPLNGKDIPKIHDIDVFVTDKSRAAEDLAVFN